MINLVDPPLVHGGDLLGDQVGTVEYGSFFFNLIFMSNKFFLLIHTSHSGKLYSTFLV